MSAGGQPAAGGQAGQQAGREALRRLTTLQQLTFDSLKAGSRRELLFFMANRSAALLPFDRAWYFDLRGRRPALETVSGGVAVNRRTAEAKAWIRRVRGIPDRSAAGLLDGEDGRNALWLPVPVNGKRYGGLLLQRLEGPAWTEEDVKALLPLAAAYGGALRIFAGGDGWRRWRSWLGRLVGVALLAALIAALVLVRLPLRIVAPCEVGPTHPVPVNAPMDGVIREVLVRPGQEVGEGDPLFVYDGDVAREELDVARKQVELVRSNLERVSALALSEVTARAEARMLDNRLAQEEVRLAAASLRVEKLRVTAPVAGTVVMGDPAEFLGKPVHTGERVVSLVDEAETMLRIWLPQDDRIDFDGGAAVRVFLHADSGVSREAELAYVAGHAQEGIDGVYGFLAEADWRGDGGAGVKLGLRGTAVLYGEEVDLWYWLLRKPLASVRRFFGI